MKIFLKFSFYPSFLNRERDGSIKRVDFLHTHQWNNEIPQKCFSFFSFVRALVMALNLMEERSQFGFYEGRGRC